MVPSAVPIFQEAQFLKDVVDAVVANFLVQEAAPRSTLLVHEAGIMLQRSIRKLALQKKIKPYFTTTNPCSEEEDTRFLPAMASCRALAEYIPSDVSVAVCLGTDRDDQFIFSNLDSVLPKVASRHTLQSIYQTLPRLLKQNVIDCGQQLTNRLESACDLITQLTMSSQIVDLVNLETLLREPVAPGCLVDWTQHTQVPAEVQPVDSLVTLSADRTYLLAGMAGDFGQSVCNWMITKGARHIILASRTPNIDPQWIEAMAKRAAHVATMAMDLASRKSVMSTYRTIEQNFPPLGGVVNGALVLEDCEFLHTSVDLIQKTLAPKVQGSRLLDELCGPNIDLDFFILVGSVAGVTGNWSQSAYAAATCFQASLVHRRRARGLVGSIIHLDVVGSIGIVARKGEAFTEHVQRTTGSYILSERDVDKFFAEAILAGNSESNDTAELVNALMMVDPQDDPDILWSNLPMMWDNVNYFSQSSKNQSSTNELGSIKAQLEVTTTMQQVSEIIDASVTAKVRSKFGIGSDVSLPISTMLRDLGMDSLVSVDLRTWFFKEMGVEIPILQITNGGSIRQLNEEVLSLLSPSLLPNVSVKDLSGA